MGASASSAAAAPVPRAGLRGRLASPASALFLGLFASQAGILVLSPILVDVARDFGVSTALAGQLRIAAVPLAVVVAVGVARSAGRIPLRSLLAAGSALVALGSLGSAVAPTFALLAVAQIPTWVGAALLIAGGLAAAASWGAEEERGRMLGRALAGPPAAWIVGMPLIGLAAEAHWRLSFLVLPLPAALVALAAFVARPADPPERRPGASLGRLLREPGARGWAAGEVLANAAWAGTLVFSGALLVEGHGASPRLAGALLALVAVAYLAGNRFAERVEAVGTRRALVRGDLAAAAVLALLWAVRPSLVVTVALFCAAAYAAAARTLWGTAYGFVVAREQKLEAGTVRAVASEVGYLFGSLLGGLAFAAGGFSLMGAVFAGLFVAAAVPHLAALHDDRRANARPLAQAVAGTA